MRRPWFWRDKLAFSITKYVIFTASLSQPIPFNDDVQLSSSSCLDEGGEGVGALFGASWQGWKASVTATLLILILIIILLMTMIVVVIDVVTFEDGLGFLQPSAHSLHRCLWGCWWWLAVQGRRRRRRKTVEGRLGLAVHGKRWRRRGWWDLVFVREADRLHVLLLGQRAN